MRSIFRLIALFLAAVAVLAVVSSLRRGPEPRADFVSVMPLLISNRIGVDRGVLVGPGKAMVSDIEVNGQNLANVFGTYRLRHGAERQYLATVIRDPARDTYRLVCFQLAEEIAAGERPCFTASRRSPD